MKSLESLLFERGLARSLPINLLKDARLGIDVNHYVSRLISSKKESLIDAVGGFPPSLKGLINSDLEVFREFNITPIFVFSGNNIVEQFNIKNSRDMTAAEKKRSSAWSQYAENLSRVPKDSLPIPPTLIDGFKEYNTPFSVDNILKDLIDFLIENGLEYIRAPYLSWIQLSYLYEVDFIDAIYGPTEVLLLSNVEKFILGIEFPTKDFRFVDKSKVLNELHINPEQLLDIAITVGCDLQPLTFPIYSSYPPNQCFFIGLDIINSGGNIYASILSLNDDTLTKRFQKGIIALQFMPVLKLNGRVELQNYEGDDDAAFKDPENCPPTDLHNIVGQRLPHEYYFYESIGLLDSKILESIIYGTYFERVPLETAITTQYKNTIKLTIDAFKNKEINLLTQNMARYYQVKKIKFSKSFDRVETELTNRLTTPTYFNINTLVIRSEEKSFNLNLFLNNLENKDLIGKSAYKLDDDSLKLNSNYEIIATSLLRTLYLLEFFELGAEKNIKPNKWTNILFKLKNLDSKYQEKYLLFLIFFKLRSFKLQEDLSEILIGSSKTTDSDKRQIVQLISRLGLFINVEEQNQYIGPISRSLLSIRSSLDAVKINTSELLDSVLINSLSNNEVSKVEKSNDDWKLLVKEVPFRKVSPNTILAIALQTLLDFYYEDESDENLIKSRDSTLDHFKSLTNLSNDIKSGLKFVQEIFKIAGFLQIEELIDSRSFEIYTKANDLATRYLSM